MPREEVSRPEDTLPDEFRGRGWQKEQGLTIQNIDFRKTKKIKDNYAYPVHEHNLTRK